LQTSKMNTQITHKTNTLLCYKSWTITNSWLQLVWVEWRKQRTQGAPETVKNKLNLWCSYEIVTKQMIAFNIFVQFCIY
jgi:hypothetical protein